eukprot:6551735-Prymnesium_polylepis.2
MAQCSTKMVGSDLTRRRGPGCTYDAENGAGAQKSVYTSDAAVRARCLKGLKGVAAQADR